MLTKSKYPRTFVDICIWGFFKFRTYIYEDNKPNYYSTYSKAFDLQAFLSGTDLNASTAWNRQLFCKNTNGKIKVRVTHDTFKVKSFFRGKEGQALLHRSNVVYHIYCSCGSNYIDKTGRNLLTRLNQHNSCSKICINADVTNHLYENSDHKIDFAKPKILGTARNQTKLFILGSLSIEKPKPDKSVDQLSITLYLFNTWYCFFPLFSFSAER